MFLGMKSSGQTLSIHHSSGPSSSAVRVVRCEVLLFVLYFKLSIQYSSVVSSSVHWYFKNNYLSTGIITVLHTWYMYTGSVEETCCGVNSAVLNGSTRTACTVRTARTRHKRFSVYLCAARDDTELSKLDSLYKIKRRRARTRPFMARTGTIPYITVIHIKIVFSRLADKIEIIVRYIS